MEYQSKRKKNLQTNFTHKQKVAFEIDKKTKI